MNSEHTNIVCMESHPQLLLRLRKLLPDDPITLHYARDLNKALEVFERCRVDILVLGGSVIQGGEIIDVELLEVIAAKSAATHVYFLVAATHVPLLIRKLKAGSYHYAKLPVSDDELRLLMVSAMENRPEWSNNLFLDQRNGMPMARMTGRSEPMQELYRQIRRAAGTDIPVLLTGATGTGKELVAQAIWEQGERRDQPYRTAHLGALPAELVASELFGHEKGAFTGALEARVGIFEEARCGTVFLDEISTLEERVQISLLRLLEYKTFRRIGGTEPKEADVRVIAASNDDLEAAVQRGRFREDLLFRLDVFHIKLPPLRERHGDIPLLVGEFVRRYNQEFDQSFQGISPECMACLETYPWPGNVRELKNVIQRSVLMGNGEILRPEHLPPRFHKTKAEKPQISFPVGTALADVEREMIVRTLEVNGNNRTHTAEDLGISRRALYNKIERYGL